MLLLMHMYIYMPSGLFPLASPPLASAHAHTSCAPQLTSCVSSSAQVGTHMYKTADDKTANLQTAPVKTASAVRALHAAGLLLAPSILSLTLT